VYFVISRQRARARSRTVGSFEKKFVVNPAMEQPEADPWKHERKEIDDLPGTATFFPPARPSLVGDRPSVQSDEMQAESSSSTEEGQLALRGGERSEGGADPSAPS
jgi:hypothetical protein